MSSIFNNSSLTLSEPILTSPQTTMASGLKNNSNDIRGQFRKADSEEVETTDSFKNKRLKPAETSIVTTTAQNSLHQEKQLKDTVTTKRSWNKWSDAELEYLKNLRSKKNKEGNTKYTWIKIAGKMQKEFPNNGKPYTEGAIIKAYCRYKEKNQQTIIHSTATLDTDSFDFEELDVSIDDNDSTESLQSYTVATTARNILHYRKPWSNAKIELLKTLISEKDEEGNTQYTLDKMVQEINKQFPEEKACTKSSLHKYISRHNLRTQEQNDVINTPFEELYQVLSPVLNQDQQEQLQQTYTIGYNRLTNIQQVSQKTSKTEIPPDDLPDLIDIESIPDDLPDLIDIESIPD